MHALRTFVLPGLVLVLLVASAVVNFTQWHDYALIGWLSAALAAGATAIAWSPRYGIMLTALGLVGSNGYLLYMKAVPQGGPSICTIDQVFDCESINRSPYSSFFFGTAYELPITLLGLAFFAGLAVAALGSPQKSPRFFHVSALFSLVNVVSTLFLASVLLTEKKLCLFCISIYIGNLLILGGAIYGLYQAKTPLFTDLLGTLRSVALVTVSLVFAGVVGAGMFALHNPLGGASAHVANGKPPPITPETKDDPSAYAAYYSAMGDGAVIELDGTEPTMGPVDAPYHVVEFADFGCPHCADAAKAEKHLFQTETDVKLTFKVFPLTQTCNPVLEKDEGPVRCLTAMAADCAHQQGKFEPMMHALFENQYALLTQFSPQDLRYLAELQALDLERFDVCMNDEKTIQGVVADALSGAKADLRGTPSFFVYGVYKDDWVEIQGHVEQVMQVIDAHRRGVKLLPPSPRPPPPEH